MQEKTEKNYGIELFRIFAMFLIVLLHVLGHGGVLGYADRLSVNYKVAWYLETIGYCSVNCYALISGYVNIHSKFKFRRIVLLWLEVFFIMTTTTILVSLLPEAEPVSVDGMLRALFPLYHKEYWYFNAYVFLFPLIPILNGGIKSLTQKQHKAIMIFAFAFCSVLGALADADLAALSYGYSGAWLMVLYIFGAYYRLYGIPKFAKWYTCLPAFFVSAFIAFEQKMIILRGIDAGTIKSESFWYDRDEALIGYLSPFMIIMAISMLCLFAKIPVKRPFMQKVISLFGKATFGVFLVHVGTPVWDLFAWKWSDLADMPTLKMIGGVFLVTLLVYLACSVYSIIRICLFKWLGINRFVDEVSEALSSKKAENEGS